MSIYWKHHTMYKSVMITRSRQRVKKMATFSVNMERYNEDEVGMSYIRWWKGSGVWSMSTSQGGCALMCGRGVELALQKGGRRWSLISSQHRQYMCTQ